MAGEESFEEPHHQDGEETTIAVAEKEIGKLKPEEPSGERRKKRWKRSIHEMLQLAQEKIDKCEDAQEREKMMQVVRHLRRQEEKLDEQDDEAWAAAHPPRMMPEASVAYYRSVLVEEDMPPLFPEDMAPSFPGGLDELRKFNEQFREGKETHKKMAAEIIDEYEANGYVEHLNAEDFELTPEFNSLLLRY